jgi:hypothetical protein
MTLPGLDQTVAKSHRSGGEPGRLDDFFTGPSPSTAEMAVVMKFKTVQPIDPRADDHEVRSSTFARRLVGN